MDKVFTPEQVKALNAYQEAGEFHPFTCPDGHVLVATEAGWICPHDDYTQNWAHGFMLNYGPQEE